MWKAGLSLSFELSQVMESRMQEVDMREVFEGEGL